VPGAEWNQIEQGTQTMFFTGDALAKKWREKRSETLVTSKDLATCAYDDAKALVMSYAGQLASDGYAEWSVLDNGDVELRFFTGEVFLLRDTTIMRVM
jgi:hypothetical protein